MRVVNKKLRYAVILDGYELRYYKDPEEGIRKIPQYNKWEERTTKIQEGDKFNIKSDGSPASLTSPGGAGGVENIGRHILYIM